MKLLGQTKGTKIDKDINNFMELEAQAVARYYALARIASAQGLHDLAAALKEIATDEAEHAGLYAVLNGQIEGDIFAELKMLSERESQAVGYINAFAQHVRDLGMDEAANAIEAVAEDEDRHGQKLGQLVERYA